MPNAEVPRIVCEEIGGCVNPYLGDRPIAAAGRTIRSSSRSFPGSSVFSGPTPSSFRRSWS